jgi:hypothetical protein
MAVESTTPPSTGPIFSVTEGGRPSAPPEPANVYEYFIGSEEDIVGLVAYAIYKQEKREWLANWRRQNSSDPSPEHFSAFISANLTPGQRHRYRNAARQVLDAYVAADYEGAPNAGRGDADLQRIEEAVARIEQRTGWLQSLWAGALGAGVVLIAVGIVTFLLHVEGFFGSSGTAQ